jgi:IS1 family transposase
MQIDELWGFVGKKAKRVKPTDSYEIGDAWTFVAIDPETKVVPCYVLGKRDPETAYAFISELRDRVPNRFQLSADGWRTYENIIEDVFGSEIDYGQAIKNYGPTESSRERYSPSEMIGVTRNPISGNPIEELISTSIIERSNLTIRTKMRRLTRLASGFSKKRSYLAFALALHFFCYNFLTVHSSIRQTPAQAAGIAEAVWSWADLFAC